MPLTKSEKETIILFNEQDNRCDIMTYNHSLQKRLMEAAAKHPEIYQLTDELCDGGVVYSLPKRMLNIRLRNPMNEEERAVFRQTITKGTKSSVQQCESDE